MTFITRLLFVLFSLLLPVYQATALTLTAEETVRESTQEVLDRLHADQDKLKSPH